MDVLRDHTAGDPMRQEVIWTDLTPREIGEALMEKDLYVSEQVIRQSAESSQVSVRAFQQIVAATNQQQIGFDQVSVAMQNIRRASEQNALGVTQLDGAAANLGALTLQLRKAVERFLV